MRHAVALGLTLALAVLLATVAPGRTVRRVARLKAALEHDPRARVRFYREFLVSALVVVAGYAAIVAVSGAGRDGAGLGWSPRASERVVPVSLGVLGAYFVAMILVNAVLLTWRGSAPVLPEGAKVLLPESRAERALWPAVSLGAGVSEELVYRGLLVLHLHALVPALRPGLLAVAAAVLFAVGHRYQGGYGVAATGVLGLGFGVVAVVTGSVLGAIVLHAVWDLFAGTVAGAARDAERAAERAERPSER